MNKKHIPNILSVIRLLLVPLFIIVFLTEEDRLKAVIVSALIYTLAGITDIVDGYLARKYNWISEAGKILDPFADKSMQAAAAVCLAIKNLLPVWVCVVFFCKEILMLIGGAIVLKRKRTLVVSSWYGKFATSMFYVVVMVLILCSAFWPDMPPWIHTVLGIVLAFSILFAVFMYYFKVFKGKFGLGSTQTKSAEPVK